MNAPAPRAILAMAALLVLLPLPAPAAGHAPPPGILDLSSAEAWLRRGFAEGDTLALPSAPGPVWTRLPDPGRPRSLRIRDLEPLLPSPSGAAAREGEWTILLGFMADSGLLAAPGGLGILLSGIGRTWELRLNGAPVRSELGAAGAAGAADRSVRGPLVALDPRLLRPGANVLAIRVRGDSRDPGTGLRFREPLLLGDLDALGRLRDETPLVILVGIAFIFGLYHLVIFGFRPAAPANLWYGAGSLLLAAYLFAGSALAYELAPDPGLVHLVELAALFLMPPLFVAYFEAAGRGRTGAWSLAYGLACLAALGAAIFLARGPVTTVFIASLPAAGLWVLLRDLALPLAAERKERKARGEAGAFLPFFLGGDRGKLLLALLALAAAAVADALASLDGREPAFARYGFLAFVLGAAAALSSDFSRASGRAERIKAHLEEEVRARTALVEKSNREQAELTAVLAASHARLKSTLAERGRDVRIAAQIQRGFFPRKAPRVAGWDLAFAYEPVTGVSGDFYDFYVSGDRLEGIVVGDVSGHGVASGLVTVLARSVFWRNFATLDTASLGRVMESVNAEMVKELQAVDNYLTAILLRFAGDGIEYANAAHPEIVFRRPGKARARLLATERSAEMKGPVLGREGLEAPYGSISFRPGPGDAFLLYTDCLIEARDEEGRAFGTEGVLEAFGRAPEGSAQEILDFVLEEWRFFRHDQGVADDLSVIVLKRT